MHGYFADLPARLRAIRRQRTRTGVAHYLANSAEMLRRLMVPVPADGSGVVVNLTRAYRWEMATLRAGHWSGDWNRAEGLRHALVAERWAAIMARREAKKVA